MIPMHNLARALNGYLDGPPPIRQMDFAHHARMQRSKLCRLLQVRITADRADLDGILNAIPDPKWRREIVMAYIRDYTSPGALLHLKISPANEWEGFDFRPLSPKGQAALKKILRAPAPTVAAFEKMLLGLADVVQ